jgi:hypothetical protein
LSSSEPPYPPEAVRHDWLLRTLMLRSLLRSVDQRRRFVEALRLRAGGPEDALSASRHLDVLGHAWRLADNLLSIYEVMANQIDIRFEGNRRAVQHRLEGRRHPPSGTFFDPIFGYGVFLVLPDEELPPGPLPPEELRDTVIRLIKRSRRRLVQMYRELLRFSWKYRSMARAYEHGRGVFAFRMMMQAEPFEFQLKHDPATLATLRRKADGSERVVEFVPDADFRADCQDLLDIAANQLAALLRRIERMEESCRYMIDQSLPKPRLHFQFFAGPYSLDEQACLRQLFGN